MSRDKRKVRGDHICEVCGLHTEQKKTKRGWVCELCHTLQPE